MKEYERRATKMIMSTVEGVKAQIRKAYDKGYKDGKADTPFTDTEEAEKKAYNRGLDDAWETVRKIIEDVVDGGYSSDVLREIFGVSTIQTIFRLNTVAEALAKIKAYEDKQKQDAEIKVGDEIDHDGLKSVVVRISNDYVYTVTEVGTTPTYHYTGTELVKTGRNFPQIVEIFKEMRGVKSDE